MPSDRTALLFCPPLAPLEIPPGGRVAIGRGKDCELVLFTDSASRRHAEVYPEGADFYVRDLGSKNGTYLNGERLERAQQLRPGDRIGVGSCAITFCRIEGTLAGFLSDPAGHETVVFSRTAAREVFRGELAEMPIFVVLQMLEMGRKSGVLEVATDSGPARLWLGDGQPAHAESEKARGMDAALAIVGATRGAFQFRAGEPPPAHSLVGSMTELLLEASRQIDESGR
ncbi:MAG TPA: FHA domain-containing protein [Myxococcota bacterium]|nr:FHA domain-containing protein [Myxococcota bacterium]